jgi:hypothetical protein
MPTRQACAPRRASGPFVPPGTAMTPAFPARRAARPASLAVPRWLPCARATLPTSAVSTGTAAGPARAGERLT